MFLMAYKLSDSPDQIYVAYLRYRCSLQTVCLSNIIRICHLVKVIICKARSDIIAVIYIILQLYIEMRKLLEDIKVDQ